MADLKPLATLPEACAALRISNSTIKRLINRGRIKVHTPGTGSKVLIPRREIETFLRDAQR